MTDILKEIQFRRNLGLDTKIKIVVDNRELTITVNETNAEELADTLQTFAGNVYEIYNNPPVIRKELNVKVAECSYSLFTTFVHQIIDKDNIPRRHRCNKDLTIDKTSKSNLIYDGFIYTDEDNASKLKDLLTKLKAIHAEKLYTMVIL